MNRLRPPEETDSPAKKIISERDEQIVSAYDAQGNSPDIPALAYRFKISAQTIRNTLERNGIKPISNSKRGRKSISGMRPNTPVHAHIAQVLRKIYADYELQTGYPPSHTLVAEEIGLNRAAFLELSAGRRDARLSELIVIAKAAKISLAELVTPKWITKKNATGTIDHKLLDSSKALASN